VLRLNRPVQGKVEQVQAAKRQHRLTDNQFPNVVVNMVTELMSQHHLDFVRRVAIQHRIAQHNAPCVAQPHQRGIRGRRLAAQVHREDAAHTRM